MAKVEFLDFESKEGYSLATTGYRPAVKDGKYVVKNGQVIVVNQRRQLVANSRLDSREWTLLDSRIHTALRDRMPGIEHLRSAGLVNPIGSIGIMEYQERVQSAKRIADVNMDTRTRVSQDRVERKRIGVPLPVIASAYEIGERELEASRRLGAPLDTVEAEESAISVAEKLEDILFNGTSEVVLNGTAVLGYLNATGALTDTATNMGGGDFGTADNAYNAVKGTLAAMDARNFRGPFQVYLNTVQYFETLMLRANTDTRQLDLIKALPGIVGVEISPKVTAGTMLLVQMTRDTIELQSTMGVSNREWMSPDDSVFYAKVMAIEIPFVKVNFSTQTGIAKITGC